MVLGTNQSGKGAKGFLIGKSAKVDKKDKKQPISRSSRAGLQVCIPSPPHRCFDFDFLLIWFGGLTLVESYV